MWAYHGSGEKDGCGVEGWVVLQKRGTGNFSDGAVEEALDDKRGNSMQIRRSIRASHGRVVLFESFEWLII